MTAVKPTAVTAVLIVVALAADEAAPFAGVAGAMVVGSDCPSAIGFVAIVFLARNRMN